MSPPSLLTPGSSAQRLGPPTPLQKPRTIYKIQLLEPLVASTWAYYDKKAASRFENHTLGGYVLQAAEWLKAEEGISDAFFDGNQRVRPVISQSLGPVRWRPLRHGWPF
jgi:hypothetical protein